MDKLLVKWPGFFQLEAMQMQKEKSAINTASASKIFRWKKYASHWGRNTLLD